MKSTSKLYYLHLKSIFTVFRMGSPINCIADLLQTKVCRCCRRGGAINEISMEHYTYGHKEVYQDMLKNTLDIQLSSPDIPGYTALLCEGCIIKLQEATSFKQMVLNSEERFRALVERLKCSEKCVSDMKTTGVEFKIEHIKTEAPPAMDYCEDSFDDNEILANIKLELSQSGAILQPEVETKYQHKRKSKLKKCKIKADIGNPKDWSKIAERRGNGPILRENSLKLLENSNIFVFQWNMSRYRCFTCKEPFSDVSLLREHSQKHNLKTIEKKIISQQNRLVKVEISILNCNLCQKSLENLDSLRDHLTLKHGIQFESTENLLVPFKIGGELACQICNEKFNVFRLLNIHMNKHYQKQVCHICGAGFSNLVFLNLHKTRSHRPLKCRQCDLIFGTKIEKKNHEVSSHNIKIERKLRFPCPYCSERFYQENFRVQHLVDKHGLKKPEFRCNICSKVFITKSLCNNHLKNVHLKEKSHECEVCHNFFYTKSDVTRHKVTHTGEKNYSCAMCNNPFASKDSLRRHMRRTHGVH